MPSFASRLLKGPEMVADQEYKKKLAEFSQQINPKAKEVLEAHYKRNPIESAVFSQYDIRLFDDAGEVVIQDEFSASSNEEAFRIVMAKVLKHWKGDSEINVNIKKQV